MAIHLSLERWPLVDTTLVGETSDDEMDVYLDAFIDQVVARRQPFVSIIDAVEMEGTVSARMRRRIARWELENAALGSRYNRGIVLVSSSALVRGIMRAIQWISPPRIPTTSVANHAEARAWAEARLREAVLSA